MPEYRLLKNRTRFSSTLDNDVYRRLKEYVEKTGVPMSKVLDKAVETYLRK